MNEPTLPWTDGTNAIDHIVDEYELAFNEGNNPDVRVFIKGEGPARQKLLLGLLQRDLQLRMRAGEEIRVSQYLSMFPELSKNPESLASLVQAELKLLRQLGRKPLLGKYEADFAAILGDGVKELWSKEMNLSSELAIGSIIAGRYKIIQELGEGGMGTVFVAEQREPVKRLVALKLIKTGMNSKTVLTRFEAERQALALMEHPHIAKMLDGGITDQNQPFFVMELVKGVPITKFCDQEHLNPKERLELFIPVCQAVQHAHQKGIIHRDLKPSNILVGLSDGNPMAKVIDFGVAKAVHQKLTERTMYTEVGSIIGTLEYMAPEQAELNNLDIDTRADIYALGVILYELLTGSTPFTGKQLRGAAFDEMLRMLREEEPPKPSTKLSASDALPNIAARRKLEPKRLRAMVVGELDWIVMKCLEKDRKRRYETANGLAGDIGRYLADEPVLAGPPSTRYRLTKFMQRNRLQVIAAALVLLALMGGIVGTTLGLLRAEHAALKEKEAKEEAETRLMQVRKGIELLSSIFKDLNIKEVKEGAEPLEAVLAKRLLKSAKDLEVDAVGDPLDIAKLQSALGLSLQSLGYDKEAVPLFTRAHRTYMENLGANDAQTLASMTSLANSYYLVGQYQDAITLCEVIVTVQKAKLGLDALQTFGSIINLTNNQAAVGKYELAAKTLEEILPRMRIKFPNEVFTCNCMGNLARHYIQLNRDQDALKLIQDSLAMRKSIQGEGHPDLLKDKSVIATIYTRQNRSQEALILLEEIVALSKTKLGADHLRTIETSCRLAAQFAQMGQLGEAIKLYEDAITRYQSRLGPDHIRVLSSMVNFANCYAAQGKHQSALIILKNAMSYCVKKPEEPIAYNCMNSLSQCYLNLKRPEDSIQLLKEMLSRFQAELDADHAHILGTLVKLGDSYVALGKHQEALQYYQDAMPRLCKKPGQNATIECMTSLAKCYDQLKLTEDSLKLLEETLVLFRTELGSDHKHTKMAMNAIIVLHADAGRRQETLELIKAMEGALAKEKPPIDFGIHNTLRHAYWRIGDNRNSMRHYDIILKANCLDSYMVTCMTGGNKDRQQLLSIFQKIIQDNKEFKYVTATAKLSMADLLDDPQAKRKVLEEVNSGRDSDLAEYQAIAKTKLKLLDQK